MKNMGVRKKLMMCIGVLIAGYVFLLGVVQWSAWRTTAYVNESAQNLLPAALNSQDAEDAFARAKKHYEDAVLLQDHKALTAAEIDMAEVEKSLGQLKGHSGQRVERQAEASALMDRIRSLKAAAAATYPSLIGRPERASPQTLEASAALTRAMSDMVVALDTQGAHTIVDFQNQLQLMSMWAGRERLISLFVLIIAILWAVASVVLLQKQIVSPIKVLCARLRDIAEGDGDLTKRLTVNASDEIGEVAASFNLFIERLQEILREVSSGMVILAGATTQISTSSGQTVQSAVRQQQETEEIASAMAEMAGSVAEASYGSQAAAEKAAHAAQTAQTGGDAVQETVLTMREVSVAVDDAALKIAELGVRSREIGTIVGVIDDIAKRTNLLALNAAIEAARVGEHGRGFAVVAGEVRSLAERTAQATSRIHEMVTMLQSGTDAVVQTMQRSTEQARLGLEATSRTGTSLSGIIEAVQQGADMITRVAGSTTQQAAGTEQVKASVGRIVNWTRQSAIDAQHSADASAELLTLAMKLQQMISKFRLDDGAEEQRSRSAFARQTAAQFAAA